MEGAIATVPTPQRGGGKRHTPSGKSKKGGFEMRTCSENMQAWAYKPQSKDETLQLAARKERLESAANAVQASRSPGQPQRQESGSSHDSRAGSYSSNRSNRSSSAGECDGEELKEVMQRRRQVVDSKGSTWESPAIQKSRNSMLRDSGGLVKHLFSTTTAGSCSPDICLSAGSVPRCPESLRPDDDAEGLGSYAVLDEDGYVEVAQCDDVAQMEVFVRRVVVDLGLHIRSLEGFKVVAGSFFGSHQDSYEGLQSEISSAADADEQGTPSWVSHIPPTPPQVHRMPKDMVAIEDDDDITYEPVANGTPPASPVRGGAGCTPGVAKARDDSITRRRGNGSSGQKKKLSGQQKLIAAAGKQIEGLNADQMKALQSISQEQLNALLQVLPGLNSNQKSESSTDESSSQAASSTDGRDSSLSPRTAVAAPTGSLTRCRSAPSVRYYDNEPSYPDLRKKRLSGQRTPTQKVRFAGDADEQANSSDDDIPFVAPGNVSLRANRRLSRGPDGGTYKIALDQTEDSTSDLSPEQEQGDGISLNQATHAAAEGVKGAVWGGAVGTGVGFAGALFTFGLSIPVCAVGGAFYQGYQGVCTGLEPAKRPKPAPRRRKSDPTAESRDRSASD